MTEIQLGLTYDDVLLVPQYSTIDSRKNVDVKSFLTPKIQLNIPMVSGNMDCVTESRMAIAMARLGGIGMIHRYMSVQDQVREVLRVKRAEAIFIEHPYTLYPHQTLKDAKELMEEANINGILITDEKEVFMGILTNRDMMFEDDLTKEISQVMTKIGDCIVGKEGINVEEAKKLMKKNKVEKLPLVDEKGILKSLVTAKDLRREEQYPLALKDKKGRLLVGCAIGVKQEDVSRAEALVNAGCNVLLIDIAHGHSSLAINAIKAVKDRFSHMEVIAGNVATPKGTEDLIKAGADCVKVGIGSGSICITRLVAGAGYPQFSAVLQCAKVGRAYTVPIMADSGIGGLPGNFSKAIAAGASTVMRSRSFAGADESPGMLLFRDGKKYKIYRGSASFGANMARNQRNNTQVHEDYNPEGVEALVPYSGSVEEIIKPFLAGLRSGMSYAGAHTIQEYWDKAEFVRMTPSGLKESHPHSVELIK